MEKSDILAICAIVAAVASLISNINMWIDSRNKQ